MINESDKTKDDFMFVMAHELRAPLVIMKGYASLMSAKPSPELSQKIIDAANRLNDLIEDILWVARIEQNRPPIELKTISPVESIKEVVEQFKPKIEAKKLNLSFTEPSQEFLILADPNYLKLILTNLLSNALKYTLEGAIEIALVPKEAENKYYISVKDTGIGMSAEEQKRLFEKFYRAKNRKVETVSGTGLGLWIVKTVCEKMNGEILIESAEGAGSKFTVVFPLAKKS